jgi:hypothetical protein
VGQQVAQQRRALGGVALDDALLDVGRLAVDLDARGVAAQQGLGQFPQRWRAGGADQYRLTLSRQQVPDTLPLQREAGCQQLVGLVQHQGLHGVQAQAVVVEQVEQAPRRGDHHVATAAQGHQLRVDRHAAVGQRDAQARLREKAGPAAQPLGHLHRQLAAGQQHQQARPARTAPLQALQERQRVGGGLARTGLGQRQCVAAGQQFGDQRRLHRRGRQQAGAAQRVA